MLSRLLRPAGNTAAGCFAKGTAARERGDWTQAIDWYRRALAIDPAHAEAHNDLGIALCAVGDFPAARTAFQRALTLRDDLISARINLGQLLFSEFREYRQAAGCFRAALAQNPAQEEAGMRLALALYECGLAEEGVECLRGALKLAPGSALAHQFLLFMSNALPQQDLQEQFAAHRAWGERHADGLPRLLHAPGRPKERLRIGYVSADFREHATASFIRPILAGHDRNGFDVFCYSNSAEADGVTSELACSVGRWRHVDTMDDGAAAQLIHADAIDILVDLSGHTRGNRLGVFARKPAPVQISYLGYLNTTGMAALDYRITDAYADPPGQSDHFHSETLLRMPQTLWCFHPPADAPAVASLPALENGHVTFGSFNHIAKLNPRVLEVWAQLMRAVPQARLRVLAVPDELAAERIRAAMSAAGVDPARVAFVPRLSRDGYWREFAQIDVALDPFPYTGGATTCEALWMGLPVVTIAGAMGFARSATTVLINAGLPECVAADRRHYLEIACRLAADRDHLAQLRANMRARLLDSPLLAAAGFVAALETLYRDAWSRHCAKGSGSC